MSCPACIKVTCAETSSLPKYIGAYSLSNGTFAQNEEAITVTTNTGNSPAEITFPPGTIQVSVPTNPVSPFTFTATYKQCNASFTIEIPPTQSAAFFDEVIQALAQQLGDCLGESATPGGGSAPHQFVNSSQTISCPGGSQMLLCNPSLYFPQGITFNSSGNGSLSIIGGIVSATTLASANAGAIQLLNSFLANMLTSQNMACGGPCPQTCAQALAALVWTTTNGSTGAGSSSGSAAGNVITFSAASNSAGSAGEITFSASITNENNTPCVYNVTLSSVSTTYTTCFRTQTATQVSFPASDSTAFPGNQCEFNASTGPDPDNNTFPGTLTIPPNSTVNLSIVITAAQDSACSTPMTISGSVTIS